MTTRQVVLFDLDGTLVDSVGDLTSAVDALLREQELEPLGEAEIRQMIGDGASMLIRRAFLARTGAEPGAAALPRFLELYGERCLDATTAYPGIPELLGALHACRRRLAVVTNKPTLASERILEGLGLMKYFHAVVGPERAPEKKPSAEHVRAALELLGASPREAVMVGDGPTDMLAGRAAGTATIGVLWGFRPKAELEEAGAQCLVANVAELARALE